LLEGTGVLCVAAASPVESADLAASTVAAWPVERDEKFGGTFDLAQLIDAESVVEFNVSLFTSAEAAGREAVAITLVTVIWAAFGWVSPEAVGSSFFKPPLVGDGLEGVGLKLPSLRDGRPASSPLLVELLFALDGRVAWPPVEIPLDAEASTAPLDEESPLDAGQFAAGSCASVPSRLARCKCASKSSPADEPGAAEIDADAGGLSDFAMSKVNCGISGHCFFGAN
jgi:hypothetical protein